MTNKQAIGALYAIDQYLDEKDRIIVHAQSDMFDSYWRGVRAGTSEVIDDITKILKKYSFERR